MHIIYFFLAPIPLTWYSFFYLLTYFGGLKFSPSLRLHLRWSQHSNAWGRSGFRTEPSAVPTLLGAPDPVRDAGEGAAGSSPPPCCGQRRVSDGKSGANVFLFSSGREWLKGRKPQTLASEARRGQSLAGRTAPDPRAVTNRAPT